MARALHFTKFRSERYTKKTKRASGTSMKAIYKTIARILARAVDKAMQELRRLGGTRKAGWLMTEESTSIRVRIDEQGYTHVTVVQWDEDGREVIYREDENFQCPEVQF